MVGASATCMQAAPARSGPSAAAPTTTSTRPARCGSSLRASAASASKRSAPNVVCHPPIVLHALGLSSSLLLKSFFFTPCGPTPPMWRVVPSCLLFFWASALNSAYKKNASAHVRAACFMPSSAGMWVSEATIPLYRHIDPRHSRRDPAPPAQRASTKPRHMTANVLPVSGGQVGTTKRVTVNADSSGLTAG